MFKKNNNNTKNYQVDERRGGNLDLNTRCMQQIQNYEL
jgi:hypothetical protein